MARFKPVRPKKGMAPQRANAIGCVVSLALLAILIFLAIYYTVKQG